MKPKTSKNELERVHELLDEMMDEFEADEQEIADMERALGGKK